MREKRDRSPLADGLFALTSACEEGALVRLGCKIGHCSYVPPSFYILYHRIYGCQWGEWRRIKFTEKNLTERGFRYIINSYYCDHSTLGGREGVSAWRTRRSKQKRKSRGVEPDTAFTVFWWNGQCLFTRVWPIISGWSGSREPKKNSFLC